MFVTAYFVSIVFNIVLIVFFTVNRGEDEYMNGTEFLVCILAILMPFFNTAVLVASVLYFILVAADKFLGLLKDVVSPYIKKAFEYLDNKVVIPPKEPK